MSITTRERKQIRLLAIAVFVVCGAFSAKLLLRAPSAASAAGVALGGAGLLILLLSLVAPAILVPGYRAWMVFARAIGWFNARAVLFVLFYGVFTPVGLFMRLIGRDVLNRKFESDQATFWVPKEERKRSADRYKHQF